MLKGKRPLEMKPGHSAQVPLNAAHGQEAPWRAPTLWRVSIGKKGRKLAMPALRDVSSEAATPDAVAQVREEGFRGRGQHPSAHGDDHDWRVPHRKLDRQYAERVSRLVEKL